MRFTTLILLLSAAIPSVLAAFGVTDSNNRLTVDTNGGLVFTVSKTTGDIISLNYKGKECQDSSKMSHISSGLKAPASAERLGNDVIKITVNAGTLTHYYIAKSGVSAVFMGTHITTEPDIGELRYIARLKRSVLNKGDLAADVKGGSVIEGKDVFLINGQTRSKFYSSKRFIDDAVHCISGSGVAACMAIGSYESSSGGREYAVIIHEGRSLTVNSFLPRYR